MQGYDAWKLATPPEYERADALQCLIENDDELDALQKRIDLWSVRAARLAAAAKADPKNARLASIATRAACCVRYAERALDDAIDERADDGYGDEDEGRDDR